MPNIKEINAGAEILHDLYCSDGETENCGRWNSKMASSGGYDAEKHRDYYREQAREILIAAEKVRAKG